MTALLPRVVIAWRLTEWELLLRRHATAGQVRFFLESRGRDVDEVRRRHDRQLEAIAAVDRAIPPAWRRARVDRARFPSFLFEPGDVIVAVGQDGLIPNLAKYLARQPVLGVNPDPARYEGTLVRLPVAAAGDLIADAAAERAAVDDLTMVEARLDDGQRLVALNEVYVGHRTHQSARYVLSVGDRRERQSSSGLIVTTGTGASGWARSISNARRSPLSLPSPTAPELAFFVREAWPSVTSGASLTEGLLAARQHLRVVSEMEEGGVAFGDGIEADHVEVGWGQQVELGVAPEVLRLVRA